MNKTSRHTRGVTLIEVFILIAILGIIAAIVIPNIAQARMSKQELRAIGEISSIHSAQTQYHAQFGRYAARLENLGPPTNGRSGSAAADLLPASLTNGVKGGYRFEVTASSAGYEIDVFPVAYNWDGRRSFYSDQSRVVHESSSPEPATLQSPVLNVERAGQ